MFLTCSSFYICHPVGILINIYGINVTVTIGVCSTESCSVLVSSLPFGNEVVLREASQTLLMIDGLGKLTISSKPRFLVYIMEITTIRTFESYCED